MSEKHKIFSDIPEVQKFSFQEDIEVGQRISVVCSVKLDTGIVSFRWLKNGKELELSKNIRIKNDQEFSVLIIDPSDLNDEGNYTCVATNSYGSGKYTAYLSVKGEIYIHYFLLKVVSVLHVLKVGIIGRYN